MKKYTKTTKTIKEEYSPEEIEYISQLTIKEYQAFKIAKQHLETSFSLKKSNGYINSHSPSVSNSHFTLLPPPLPPPLPPVNTT